MTLEQMLDTYPADVRERILTKVNETVGYAKADLPYQIAEEFGNAGLRNADLGALKALIASAAEAVAIEIVGLLGVYYKQEYALRARSTVSIPPRQRSSKLHDV